MPPRFQRTLLAAWLVALGAAFGTACERRDADADAAATVEVRVGGVAVDERSQSPVVVLEELGGMRRLPIWIGFAEASSIASQLESVEAPRPNTHDLAKRLIDGLEGSVVRVVVTHLDEGVYYARIELRRDGRRVDVDARPSDAIAIALRVRAPLFVSEPLFEEAGAGLPSDEERRI